MYIATMNIVITINDNEARALSQILKRIGHEDVKRLSYDENELYLALTAIEAVRCALRDNGFNPR
jgi:hypothetical protein